MAVHKLLRMLASLITWIPSWNRLLLSPLPDLPWPQWTTRRLSPNWRGDLAIPSWLWTNTWTCCWTYPLSILITIFEGSGTCMMQWSHMWEDSERLEWLQTPMVACSPQSWWTSCPWRYSWSSAERSSKRNRMWRNSWISLTEKSIPGNYQPLDAALILVPSLRSHSQVHYLPHHGVVRQDKTTSKLRIVTMPQRRWKVPPWRIVSTWDQASASQSSTFFWDFELHSQEP